MKAQEEKEKAEENKEKSKVEEGAETKEKEEVKRPVQENTTRCWTCGKKCGLAGTRTVLFESVEF